MIAVTALLFAFLTCVALYLQKSTKRYLKNFPPGPPNLPIWGSYWFILKENFSFLHLAFEKLGRKYKTDVLGLYFGTDPTIVTLSYNLTKELLTRDEFSGRLNTVIVKIRSESETPKGILFSEGEFWKSHRRFTLRHLRDYGFGRRSDSLEDFTMDEIKQVINNFTNPPKTEINVYRGNGQVKMPQFLYGPMTNMIMSVICSTQLDTATAIKFAETGLRFLQTFDTTGKAITITPWLRFFAPDYFGYTSAVEDNKFLKEFMKEIIEEHLKTFSEDHHRDFIDDFLSENIRQGTELDSTQLALTAIDFIIPTPIATGHTIAFLFALLINNPHVQKNIHEELDRVVGRSKYPDLDDRPSLPYLDAAIREATRIFPVTPLGVIRQCLEDTTLGGYDIPKDTVLMANIWTAHHDETVFPNPEVFKPERFLNPDGSLMRKDLTVGFGGGKRLCAGETFAKNTMFLIIACLLQNFTVTSVDGTFIDMNQLDSGIALSLKPTWIQFVQR